MASSRPPRDAAVDGSAITLALQTAVSSHRLYVQPHRPNGLEVDLAAWRPRQPKTSRAQPYDLNRTPRRSRQ